MVVLGLLCHMKAFFRCFKCGLISSCGSQVSHSNGLSLCGALPLRHADASILWCMGSVVGAQGMYSWGSVVWLTALVAPQQMGSSQTRYQTCVFCIGGQILNHWTTREVW